jgi:hypothetical protein
MTVMVHVPIVGMDMEDEEQAGIMQLPLEQAVGRAVGHWGKQGADGIFLDGLENFAHDEFVGKHISSWDVMFTKYGTTKNKRILMTSYRDGRKSTIFLSTHLL